MREYPISACIYNMDISSRENNLTSSNHLATHVQQLLHVLIHHRLGLLVELLEQARAEDLVVGHRCPEDAQGIAERIVCMLERSLACDDVEREQLIKLLLLVGLDGEVLKVPLPRFALQRRG